MQVKRRDNKGRVLRNGENQRKDGKYMFRYTDNDGGRHTVYSWRLVSSDRLKEGQKDTASLRDMEAAIQKDLEDGIRTADAGTTTVDDLFEQFMDLRKDLRESSRCCYKDIYRKHIGPAIGNKVVGEIKPTEIQRVYQDMVAVSGVSPTTAQKAHSIVYQIFENAVMDDLIRVNPAAKAFQNLRKTADLTSSPRDPLTVEQQERFIDYVYHSKKYEKMANLFTVLLGTGMRIGEALGLRWCDCDFGEGVIHVTHALLYKQGEDGRYRYRITAPKTEAGYRDIPMFTEVEMALRREHDKKRPKRREFVVDGYKGFVFLNSNGQVYTQAFIYDTIQRITASYNAEENARALEEDRKPNLLPKMSAHILRHTYCTRMCEQNTNMKVLQDVMGHRSIRTTMEVYTKAMHDKKMEEFRAINGSFRIS